MNDDANNLNGTVLGSVDNTPVTPDPNVTNNVETLDMNVDNSQVINNNNVGEEVVEPTPVVNNPEPVTNNTVVDNPTPTPEPEVAYTNPQTINPMPGFESSNNIGTTPPISLEPEKQPKQKGTNKVLFVIVILIVLGGVGFGTYYVLKYTDLLKSSASISVVTKDLEVNLNESLSTNITDYAEISGTDSKNCSLNTVNVDTSKEGSYEYTITCGETIKTGKINVVDNSELVVALKTVYKVKGETLEAKEFVKKEENNTKYEFVNADEVKKILEGDKGTFTVKIKITSNNKSNEFEGKLVIMEYPVKGFIKCSSNEQNVSGTSAIMTVSERFAILDDEDGQNSYGNIATEIHTFKFSDETEYASYVAKYKSEKSVTINDITGEATFDDENKLITMEKDLDNNEVIEKYKAENMINYKSIKKHFNDTLGYKCVYEK